MFSKGYERAVLIPVSIRYFWLWFLSTLNSSAHLIVRIQEMWEFFFFFYCFFFFKLTGRRILSFLFLKCFILCHVSRLNVVCLENFTLLEYSFKGYICFSGKFSLRQENIYKANRNSQLFIYCVVLKKTPPPPD